MHPRLVVSVSTIWSPTRRISNGDGRKQGLGLILGNVHVLGKTNCNKFVIFFRRQLIKQSSTHHKHFIFFGILRSVNKRQ